MATNVRGTWLGMKHAIPRMLATGGGSIVNLSSIYGLHGNAGQAAYSASKHAVIGLTKTAAIEYARKGIRVNAVCPAAHETDMYFDFRMRSRTRSGRRASRRSTRWVASASRRRWLP